MVGVLIIHVLQCMLIAHTTCADCTTDHNVVQTAKSYIQSLSEQLSVKTSYNGYVMQRGQ